MPHKTREVAFIDPQANDVGVLCAGLRPGVAAVLLNATEPAPRQMARALAGRRGLAAIHVIAHGAPGELRFAAGTLSADSIAPDDAALAECGRSLRAGGGIALWSCHAGAGAAGAALLGALSAAAGAPAAASTALVGAAARGGRWNLDRRTGGSKVRVPLTDTGIAAFQGVMATRTWVGGSAGHLTDWSWSGNWSGGVAPGSGDDVVIPTVAAGVAPILSASTTVNSINITGTTSLRILSGTTLTVTTTIDLASSGGILGAGVIDGLIVKTGTAAATITAAGTLELQQYVADFTGQLALDVATSIDTLKLDADTQATSLTLNGGTVEIGGALELSTVLAIGSGTVILAGNAAMLTSTATGASTIGTGTITGVGTLDLSLDATGAAKIIATGGTLELQQAVTNSGGALELVVTGAGDTLLLDAATAATFLSFKGSSGTLEIGSAGSLTLTALLDVGVGTVRLAGNAARLTNKAGIILPSTGGITGAGIVTGPITAASPDTATITASGGRLELQSGVTNEGVLALLVTGAGDTLLLDAATAATSLSFNGSSGTLEIGSAGNLTLTTALDVGAGTVKLDGNAAQLQDAAGITLDSTGGITGAGIVTGPIAAVSPTTATIAASGGTLVLGSAVTNTGSLALLVTGSRDTLLLDAATAATSLSFNNSTGTLEIGSAGGLLLTTALDVGAGTVKLDGNAAGLSDIGGITLDSTGGITGAGSVIAIITGTSQNTATITASGGTLDLIEGVTNAGSLALVVAGSDDMLVLDEAGKTNSARSLSFNGNRGTLETNGDLTLTTALDIGSGTVELEDSIFMDKAGITLDSGGESQHSAQYPWSMARSPAPVPPQRSAHPTAR